MMTNTLSQTHSNWVGPIVAGTNYYESLGNGDNEWWWERVLNTNYMRQPLIVANDGLLNFLPGDCPMSRSDDAKLAIALSAFFPGVNGKTLPLT